MRIANGSHLLRFAALRASKTGPVVHQPAAKPIPLSSGAITVARRLDALAIGVLVLTGVIAVATFRDYGLGWDDYTHSQYGDLLVSLYSSGFVDKRALSFVNLYMYGGGFDMLAALAGKVLPFDHFETRRLIGAVIGLIGLMVTWRLGRRLGGPTAGLVALILLAICPLYYGHMFINPKDAPFAVAMVLLLLGMVRAAQEYPQPQPATVALVGLGLGLTIGTRVIGGISGFYALGGVAFILAVEAATLGVRGAAARFGRFLVCLVPGIILAYLTMGLVWPWSVVEPLNPLRAVEYFSHFFEKPWKEMFNGALLPVPDMPRSYVPTLFVLKIPEVLLALGLGGIAGVIVTLMRRDVPVQQRAALLMVALAATLPIAFTVITRPAMYNGIRHFVFVTPPLAALGGWAGAWLLARAQAIGRPALAAAAAVLLGLAALPAIDMVRLHPYQYTHFNQFAGGIRAADERYMIDYWGLAFKQAAQQLRARLVERLEVPTGSHWRIAVCGPHAPPRSNSARSSRPRGTARGRTSP